MLSWLVAGVALVIALVAWRAARKAAGRVEQLTRMYWTLRYQQDELRAAVERGRSAGSDPADTSAGHAAGGVPDGFVPLSSLKQK